VCLRAGRWYFEVNVRSLPQDQSRGINTAASIGFVTRDFEWSGANSSGGFTFGGGGQQLGVDNAGQSWGMDLPSGDYRNEGKCLASVVGDPSSGGLLGGFGVAATRSTGGLFGGGGGAADAAADDEALAAAMEAESGKASSKKKEELTSEDLLGALGSGSTIGVMVDVDAGKVWYRVCGKVLKPAFTGANMTKGVHPAAFVRGANPTAGLATLSFNFGREDFKYVVPPTFMAIEALQVPQATWLTRFEHAATVTNMVYQRQALPEAVVQLALRRELGVLSSASSDAAATGGDGGGEGDGAGDDDVVKVPNLEDDADGDARNAAARISQDLPTTMMPGVPFELFSDVEAPNPNQGAFGNNGALQNYALTSNTVMFTAKLGGDDDSAYAYLHSIAVSSSAAFSGCNTEVYMFVFLSDQRPAQERLRWVERLESAHFDALLHQRMSKAAAAMGVEGPSMADVRARQGLAPQLLPDPVPDQPVEMFTLAPHKGRTTLQLPRTYAAKYVTLLFKKKDAAPGANSG
jgi:hypothetical protein